MDGRAIAAGAVGDAALRRLVTELAGPRPAGTSASSPAGRNPIAAGRGDPPAKATKP